MTTNDLKIPFVKKFEDGGDFYVYDVNTNRIIEVDKPTFDIIDEYEISNVEQLEIKFREKINPIELKRSIAEINSAREEHGLFSTFRPETVTMGSRNADDVKKLHRFGLNQLVLEITRQCNLNCRYCSASGKYADHETSQIHMNSATWRQAVDFFCQRTDSYQEPFITFYGGEPLLKFDVIKEIVEYVNSRYKDKKYNFNLTTNGTVLNKKIYNFFVENDFSVMVSLDGLKEVNDRYRLFKNGRGTFKRIMNNLEFMKKQNPEYFYRQVSIACVFSPPFDKRDEIINFFSSQAVFDKIRENMRSNLVDTRETSFIEDFGLEEDMAALQNIEEKDIERIKEKILGNRLSSLTIEKNKIYSILYNLSRRHKKGLRKQVQPLGACHIGLKRVFIRPDGSFYICERSGKEYKIGSLDTGFDYHQIAHYYTVLEDKLKDCRNCWAQLFCERCWVQLGNIEEFEGERKERFCLYNKNAIIKAFKLYVQLLRENPDSLKVFKAPAEN